MQAAAGGRVRVGTHMERQRLKVGTEEKLLVILEGNVKGPATEEREKKWDALEEATRRAHRAAKAPDARRVLLLERENARLRNENAQLKKELEFLRRTPTLAQGLKGETLIAKLTDGVRTGYKDPHDITVKNGDRLEVKFSHMNVPNKSKTRRWNWNSVLGSAHNKKYEYLVLVGEKDLRYEGQYPASLAFVFFLVPRSDVDNIRTGDDIAINTNLKGVWAPKSLALERHLVMSEDAFTNLLSTADTNNTPRNRNE